MKIKGGYVPKITINNQFGDIFETSRKKITPEEKIEKIKKPASPPVVEIPISVVPKNILFLCPLIDEDNRLNLYFTHLFDREDVGIARTFQEVADQMSAYDVLHIQYDEELYNDKELIQFIETLKNKYNINIFITINTLISKKTQFYQYLSRICHVVVNNSIPARFNQNINFIEPGCIKLNVPFQSKRNDRIATFGFSTSIKNTESLGMIANELDVEIDVYSPNEHAKSYSRVNIINDYISTEELLEKISQYRLLLFLRRNSSYLSASHSVRLAFNCRVPIVCQSSPYFGDLAQVVKVASYEDIPKIVNDLFLDESQYHETIAKQEDFLEQHTVDEAFKQHLLLYERVLRQ